LIASCVDKIYSDDEVWTSADVTKKELLENSKENIQQLSNMFIVFGTFSINCWCYSYYKYIS
jgi:hypothetical protein